MKTRAQHFQAGVVVGVVGALYFAAIVFLPSSAEADAAHELRQTQALESIAKTLKDKCR